MDPSDNQKSRARIKTASYLMEYHCKSLKPSIATLLEETKQTVTEKYEIEYRQKSKTFDYSECLNFDRKNA